MRKQHVSCIETLWEEVYSSSLAPCSSLFRPLPHLHANAACEQGCAKGRGHANCVFACPLPLLSRGPLAPFAPPAAALPFAPPPVHIRLRPCLYVPICTPACVPPFAPPRSPPVLGGGTLFPPRARGGSHERYAPAHSNRTVGVGHPFGPCPCLGTDGPPRVPLIHGICRLCPSSTPPTRLRAERAQGWATTGEVAPPFIVPPP
jgi:hypothetical protein